MVHAACIQQHRALLLSVHDAAVVEDVPRDAIGAETADG